MRQRVFIAIGSNIGRRRANCEEALKRLGCAHTTVIKKSLIYETPAWGVTDQGDFINQVVIINTDLLPRELLKFLKSIETEMGRQKNIRWGPRLIDLDIIFYGDKIIEEEGLIIPHPFAHQRAFVMEPASEVAPDFIHPKIGKTTLELARLCSTG